VRVLKSDLKLGDEIAVKPGDRKLEYRGAHFPVTDMVYLASGTGIVPILEQVRAVLPNGQSSVKSVTVIWMDEDAGNFDVIADQLEREYHKYTTKLAVSCVVDNMRVNSLADNTGIVNAVPEFIPGTMAVLSGPRAMQRKAVTYLTSRGYPEDCICML
jgi:NAD(P)H-flavin reductase